MRIIYDCDPGVDDTYALIYLAAAVHAGTHELECVTTTAGNVEADQCARNAAWILSLCGLPIIPLAAGIPGPLEWELTTTPETHGDTGLGYAHAPDRHVEHDWHRLWIDAIERGTDDLHLIVTGPMTNLAAFQRLHPDHYARLRHITVMGGAFNYPGNTTPTAEWNFWVDPHAAKEVFANAPAPITICPLNATEQMLLTPAHLHNITETLGTAPIATQLDPITRFYFEFHEDMGEGYQAQIHDLFTVLTATGAITPESQLTTVDVEADSELTRGTSVADTKDFWERDPNAHIITSTDTATIERAWTLFDDACHILSRIATGDAALEKLRHLRAED